MAKAFARGRPIAPLVLSAPERAYLERQVRRHRVTRSLSERCRVILRCADGLPSKSVGAELGLHEHTVGKWRRRFLKDRCEGLLDEARPGRPRTIDDDQVAAVIERTLRTTPADATHWSIRSMAAETGFPRVFGDQPRQDIAPAQGRGVVAHFEATVSLRTTTPKVGSARCLPSSDSTKENSIFCRGAIQSGAPATSTSTMFMLTIWC